MKRIYKFLEKLSGIFYLGQKVILVIMAVALVAINVTGVVLRFVFRSGISWSQEASIALFMSLIFLGANISIKSDSEIRIDLIRLKNENMRRIWATITDIVCLAIMGYLLVSSIASVKNAMENRRTLELVKISYAVLYTVMPIGVTLMFLDKVVAILRRFYDKDLALQLRKDAEEMENKDV